DEQDGQGASAHGAGSSGGSVYASTNSATPSQPRLHLPVSTAELAASTSRTIATINNASSITTMNPSLRQALVAQEPRDDVGHALLALGRDGQDVRPIVPGRRRSEKVVVGPGDATRPQLADADDPTRVH